MRKAMKQVMASALVAVLTIGTAVSTMGAVSSPTTSLLPKTQYNVVAQDGNTVDTNADGTIAIGNIKKTKKKTFKVPEKMTVDNVNYTVVAVKGKAFTKCKKAKTIVIPKTVKLIKKKAFTGAKSVKKIVFKGTKAVTIKKGAFKGKDTKKITVKVSKKMSKKQFKKFKKNLKKAGFKGKIKK